MASGGPKKHGADGAIRITFRTTTRLVQITVVVHDRDGKPVRDLKLSDFVLSDKGKAQKISTFSAFTGASPVTTAVKPVAPNVVTNRPAIQVEGQTTVILLDALNSTMEEQNQSRNQLLSFVDKYQGDRPVALFQLGTQLIILQGFTTDKAKLRSALEGFKATASPGVEQSRWAYDLAVPKAPGGMNEAQAEQLTASIEKSVLDGINGLAEIQVEWRVPLTVAGMRGVAQYIAQYPGRKTLVWVSSAFPINLGAESLETHRRRLDSFYDLESIRRNYEHQIEALAGFLADNNVAVYPVDSHQLRLRGINATDTGRTTFSEPMDIPTELSKQSQQQAKDADTMRMIAELTGGEPYLNRNDLDTGVLRAIDDGASYYTLGYYPSDKNWDGNFRKIKVELKGHNYDLHYRKGYYAVDFATDKRERANSDRRMLTALKLGMVFSTQLLFDAAMENRNGSPAMRFEVDANRLEFTTAEDGKNQASLDIGVAFYQGKKLVKADEFTASIRLTEESYQAARASGLTVHRTLEVPPGTYTIRIAVRDMNSGRLGSTEAAILVK